MTDTTQATADLSAVSSLILAGNNSLATSEYAAAIQSYQQAGTTAQSIRSDLGNPTDTNLDAADTANQTLQGLSQTNATQADAQQAQSLAQQISASSTAAISTASAPSTPTATPAASTAIAPTNPTALPTNFWWTALAITAGVAGLGWLTWKIFFNRAGARSNPSGRKGPKRSKSKALINKGKNAEFDMKDGSSFKAKGGMLHDPSGRYWPKNSVLFGPYKSGSTPNDENPEAEHYLARKPREGSIDTPSRELASWKYLGEVEEIFYTRTGNRKPGRYRHAFSKSGALATVVMGKGRAKLYRLGRFYRLQLPRGAILDSRGYVWP